MTDHAIRRYLVEKIASGEESFRYRDEATRLDTSEAWIKGNMQFLADNGYLKAYYSLREICRVIANERTSSYLMEFDSSGNKLDQSASSPHEYSTPEYGKNLSMVLTGDLESEFQTLLTDIRDANCPKKEQETRIGNFLTSVAGNCTSNVIVSCASEIFKAAVGLTRP